MDEILASKVVRGTLKYQVSWKGDDLDSTWYAAWNLIGCPEVIKQFHDTYPDAPGPPKYLDEWLDCWKAGTGPVEHQDKNAVKA